MTPALQTVFVAVIVAAAATVLLWRAFGRRAKPGCGCNGCPKAPAKR